MYAHSADPRCSYSPPVANHVTTFNSYGVTIAFSDRCTPPFLVGFPLLVGRVYAGGTPGLTALYTSVIRVRTPCSSR